MTTSPQLVCLFKTLVNQVAFSIAIYWLPGEFKGNLCTAVTLYITVTWPFPKDDRYIQVWLWHTSWITSGPKSNFICDNIPTKAILFFFGCLEVTSTLLITSELANQRARKVLFTCVVYTNQYYYFIVAAVIINTISIIILTILLLLLWLWLWLSLSLLLLVLLLERK